MTLDIYADGWAALYLRGIEEIENSLTPLISGQAEWSNGMLVIRQDGVDPVSVVPVALFEGRRNVQRYLKQ